MNRIIIILTALCGWAAYAEGPIEAPVPAPRRTPVFVVFSTEEHSRSARSQLEALSGTCERSRLYQQRFATEREYVTRHFDLRILDEHQAPVQLSYPAIRTGYSDWQAFTRFSCYPGHFPQAVYAVCREHRVHVHDNHAEISRWRKEDVRRYWDNKAGRWIDDYDKLPDLIEVDLSQWLVGYSPPSEAVEAPEPDDYPLPPGVPIHGMIP